MWITFHTLEVSTAVPESGEPCCLSTMESNWTVSLFIGKHWRFRAGNRSCVSLVPWLCLRVSCQRVKEPSQTFFFSVCVYDCDCVDDRKRSSVLGCVKAFFFFFTLQICVFLWSVCPHAFAEEGKPYLLEQHPHTPNPPSTSLQLFIRHIIAEYKQRRGAFSCASARLWSAGLPLPRILSSNEGTNAQSLR